MRSTGVSCSFVEYVSHREAIQEMVSADALLLALPSGNNAESVIAAKLFEYLAAHRPILVVGPVGGECAKIVESLRAGVTSGFDAGSVGRAIDRLYGAWRAGRPVAGCRREGLDRFSRVELTGKLASLLDRLVDGDVEARRNTSESASNRTPAQFRPVASATMAGAAGPCRGFAAELVTIPSPRTDAQEAPLQ